MRDWTGLDFSALPGVDHPSFVPRLRRAFSKLDAFLRDASAGFGRIQNGQTPDGSGDPIPLPPDNPTLDDYLYLPGRLGGQEVEGLDSNPTVTIDSGATGLTVDGSIGNPIFRLKSANTPILDFRPYLFGSATEIALTDETGTGVPVNFPSDDGTSALRITSTTNRTFLQAGLRNSAGNVINSNMTIGATGARVMTSLATEIQRIQFSNAATTAADGSAITARTTRIGVNIRPDDYAGSAVANKPGGLHVAGNNDGTDSTPAPFVLERGNVTGTTSARNLLEVRGDTTGSSPNQQVGSVAFALDGAGRAKFYNGGTYVSQIVAGASNTGTVSLLDASSNNVAEFQPLTRFADTVATANVKLGVTTANALVCGGGYNILARLGISATSIVLGPANSITLPAPVSSRIMTLVNSSGSVLSYFDSVGRLFVDAAANTSTAPLTVSHDAGNTTDFLQAFEDANLGFTVSYLGEVNTGSDAPLRMWYSSGSIGSGDPVIMSFANVGAAGGGTTVDFPVSSAATVTIVTTAGTQALTNKTITAANVASSFNSSTASSGANFQDVTTSTKKLRMVLSGAVGNNSFTLTNTAARNFGFGNLSGNVVVVGDDPPAVASGSLGKVDLTAQTAAIGSTNLTSTPPAGLYEVLVYAACTTASGAGAPTLDVNVAWTDAVGATNRNLTADPGATAFPLSLAGTGRTQGRVLVQLASGDISYSTTINAAAGTPQYAIYIRVVALG